MKKDFSPAWVSSKQRRKQRKYRANAPLHLKRKFVSANLAKNLREKYQKRSVPIRKGDSVKIMRGSYRGKSGKVEEVDVKRNRVFVAGIDFVKKDGSKVKSPLSPSNLQITSLVVDDDRRFGMSEGKGKKTTQEGKEEPKKADKKKAKSSKDEKESSRSSSSTGEGGKKKSKSQGKKTKKSAKKKGSKSKSGKTKTKKDSTKNSGASD